MTFYLVFNSSILFLCFFAVPIILKEWILQEKITEWNKRAWVTSKFSWRARDFWDDCIIHLWFIHVDWPFQCSSPEMCSRISWNDRRTLLWQSLWALRSISEPSGSAELGCYSYCPSKMSNITSLGWRALNCKPLHWVLGLYGLHGDSWPRKETGETNGYIGGFGQSSLVLWKTEGNC